MALPRLPAHAGVARPRGDRALAQPHARGRRAQRHARRDQPPVEGARGGARRAARRAVGTRHPAHRRRRAFRRARARRVRRARRGGARSADRANPRRLRVTTTPSFAARWLLPRLQRFGSRRTRTSTSTCRRRCNGRPRAREHRRRDPLRVRPLAGPARRVPARRCVLPGGEPAPGRDPSAQAARGPRPLPAAAQRGRAVETVVRGGRARLAGARARTGLRGSPRSSSRPRSRARASRSPARRWSSTTSAPARSCA